jgi:hypothetical protein
MKKTLASLALVLGTAGLFGGCGEKNKIEAQYDGKYKIDGKEVNVWTHPAGFTINQTDLGVKGNNQEIVYISRFDKNKECKAVDQVKITGSNGIITVYDKDIKRDSAAIEIAQKQFEYYLKRIQEIRLEKIHNLDNKE